ncbi:Glyceraldehyde-3-phosphate dehydrogenase 3 [Papilio xuthus]|uniref:Glyceraldehyde-3-phosphate dehydrogenase 3 n=1 Tax=Papilio xuthus TaxID=66420 RepID=A0A194QHA8_PAPXU|nr:Glyceraldehyde-3-phosphate dehydrogenase 3 [Papilio xuthus]
MVIKVGINGFGRIGRIMFRTCILNPDVEVAAVNDPAVDVDYICYLIKFDSIHGKFEGDVAPCKGDIQINGDLVKIFRAKQPCDVPWNTAGVQYVIESSGMFTNLEKAAGHLSVEGVKRVVVTAPSSDVPMIILGVNDDKLRADQRVISCASSTLYCLAPIMKVLENNYGVSEGFVTSIHAMTPSLKPLDGLCLRGKGHLSVEGVKRVVVTAPSSDVPMIILGVNDDKLRADQRVISCASSTLYCLAPIMKVLENNYGVSEGFVTSIHAMTPSLKPLDGLCLRGKHWRDFRSIHQNVIPAMTGACKALGKILPELKDKMVGLAFRVPIVNVSVLDLTIRLSKKTTLENIVKNVENASETYLQEVLNISKEEAVSSDFIRDSHSCILDVNSSLQLRPDFFKLICWYENEFSYACRVMDLIIFCEKRFEQKQTVESKVVEGVSESPTLTDTAAVHKRFKPVPGTCRQQVPNIIKNFSKSVYSSIQDLQPLVTDVPVAHQGTFTDRQPKKVNELSQVPTDDDIVKNVLVSKSIQNIVPTSSACKSIEAKPSVNKNIHKSTKHERNDFNAQNHLESVRRELNKMMNVTQGLLEKSNKLCDPFKFKIEDPDPRSIPESKKNKVDRSIAFVESNESMQCTGCLTKSQGTVVVNKQVEKACSGRGDTKNDNVKLMSVEHSVLTEDPPQLHGDDISKFHVKTLYDTNFEEIADSRHAGELVQKRAITKLQKTSTSFLRENPYVYAFNKKHEFRNEQLKKQLQKASPVSIKMEGINLASNEAHCSENISRYIIVQETENAKDRKFLGQRLVGKQNILVQKQVICENVELHSNDNAFVKRDENKQDIFDKLDSTSATNSENSFHVKEKQSQVICINDLTNSLEDLSRLEKICKIIEISDDLSDELFSKLKPTEQTNMKNKKWSFKDLCAKIKLDDFCDKVFRE